MGQLLVGRIIMIFTSLIIVIPIKIRVVVFLIAMEWEKCQRQNLTEIPGFLVNNILLQKKLKFIKLLSKIIDVHTNILININLIL